MMPRSRQPRVHFASLRRTWALTRKETLQVLRDPSSIALGVIMPVLLILLFGYGLSVDVRNVTVAIVLEDSSADSMALAGRFQLSDYFQPTFVRTWNDAEELMLSRKVDAIVRIPRQFSDELSQGRAQVQLIVNGSDANRARIIQGYVRGVVVRWTAELPLREGGGGAAALGPAVVVDRLWFNEANDSRYFLVPGLIVLIMTLIGAFMTAMVVAREWERGTLEAIFVTPMKPGELLLSKMVPYFVLGMIGFTLCVLAGRFLFDVPLRGSLVVLVGVSMIYLLVALGIGLLISTVTRSQFVASQIALIGTFLPALLLSGFIFDLRSMPDIVRVLTYALPARYYVSLLQTIFLAGNVWSVIIRDTLVLAAMAAALLGLTRLKTKKRLVG